MRDRHDAGVVERNAEIEDVGMRVKVIGGRVDRLGAFQSNPLTGLRCRPNTAKEYARLPRPRRE